MSTRFRLTIYVTLERLVQLLTPYKGEITNNEALMFIRQFNTLVADNFIWELMLDVPHAPEEHNPHINGIDQVIDEYFNMHRPEEQSSAVLAREVRTLRRLFGTVNSSGLLYTDDGELSDSSKTPAIDYRRDSLATIQAKLKRRAERLAYYQQHGKVP